jgi:hypothetical protein
MDELEASAKLRRVWAAAEDHAAEKKQHAAKKQHSAKQVH